MISPDMRVNIAGIELKNPILTASGTFGFGKEYAEYYDLSILGGVAVKGITLKKKLGNKPPRIAETPMGILNSIGLQNPGVESFIEKKLPFLRQFDTKVIVNIAGETVEEYVALTERLSNVDIDMIELNISCPNVKEGGLAFGARCDLAGKVVSECKKKAKKPLIAKLSPNVTDITEIAKAAEDAGADALSLINTLMGMRIDVNTRRPVLANIMGGLSGPAVKPVAVRMIWQVKNAVKLPIIGMGGVMTGEDAAELMLAGADAVAVGTANLTDPYACVKILDELEVFLSKKGYRKASDLTGGVITE